MKCESYGGADVRNQLFDPQSTHFVRGVGSLENQHKNRLKTGIPGHFHACDEDDALGI